MNVCQPVCCGAQITIGIVLVSCLPAVAAAFSIGADSDKGKQVDGSTVVEALWVADGHVRGPQWQISHGASSSVQIDLTVGQFRDYAGSGDAGAPRLRELELKFDWAALQVGESVFIGLGLAFGSEREQEGGETVGRATTRAVAVWATYAPFESNTSFGVEVARLREATGGLDSYGTETKLAVEYELSNEVTVRAELFRGANRVFGRKLGLSLGWFDGADLVFEIGREENRAVGSFGIEFSFF